MVKDSRKKAPKAWEKFDRDWRSKMDGEVCDFVFNLLEHIDWKKRVIEGDAIEQEVWKLLVKTRRITQRESK